MANYDVAANFTGMSGNKLILWQAAAVPPQLWRCLQIIQQESLRSHVPRAQWEQLDPIVHSDNLQAYLENRADPNNINGRHGWRVDQVFRDPLVAVTYDQSNQPIAALLTADNSSENRLPAPFRKASSQLKMKLQPGLSVPFFGNKRYVHVRETYVHPDVQSSLALQAGVTEVSGIALSGLYFSLLGKYKTQDATAYLVHGDPADLELTQLATSVGMEPTPNARRPNGYEGYRHDTYSYRVRQNVGQILSAIKALPGVAEVLSVNNVTYIPFCDGQLDR